MGSTDGNGYYTISVKPTNIGGPFALSFAVTSIYGNYNTIQSNLTVTAPLVVPVANVLAGTVIAGQTGTMPAHIAGAHTLSVAWWTGGGTDVYLCPPVGYYDGGTYTHWNEPNLVPGNIANGVSILGVTGTFAGAPPTHGTQTWTTAGSYSFTVPNGVYSISAIITGGGGGGGGEGGGYHGGGGGAGGFGVVVNIPVTPGQVIPVTVGAGGALGEPYMSGPGWWSAPYGGVPGGSTSVGSTTVGGGLGGGSSNQELYLPIAWGGAGAGYGQTGAAAPWKNDGGTWGYNHGLFYSAGGTGIGGGSGGTGSSSGGQAGRAIIQW